MRAIYLIRTVFRLRPSATKVPDTATTPTPRSIAISAMLEAGDAPPVTGSTGSGVGSGVGIIPGAPCAPTATEAGRLLRLPHTIVLPVPVSKRTCAARIVKRTVCC